MSVQLNLPRGLSPDIVKGYCLLYQLETWLRELLYLELKAHFGLNWWSDVELALKRNRALGIPPQKSVKRDKAHPHMSTPETDPLWYLSFDSLLKIIYDRKLWRLFQPYLITKRLLRAKIEEISSIRNRIAHIRSLHKHDLSRIEAVLRDLDQGFWKFCTSYNRTFGFVADLRNDPVYQHFANREHVPWTEVEPGKWARVGFRTGVDVDVSLDYSIRPSSKQRPTKKIHFVKGAIYNFTFSTAHTSSRLDYPKILAATRGIHNTVLHIYLSSFQGTLEVTLPAVIDYQLLVSAAEEFYRACLRYRDAFAYRDSEREEGKDKDSWQEYEEAIRPFEQIAASWPHYVVPPSHPYTFLTHDMPCRFFENV